MSIDSLIEEWREQAANFRTYKGELHADILETCASQLEARIRQYWLEGLTLDQGVAESGYSYSALQKKVANGELENVGEKHSPRIRRKDLPKKGRTTTDDAQITAALLGHG